MGGATTGTVAVHPRMIRPFSAMCDTALPRFAVRTSKGHARFPSELRCHSTFSHASRNCHASSCTSIDSHSARCGPSAALREHGKRVDNSRHGEIKAHDGQATVASLKRPCSPEKQLCFARRQSCCTIYTSEQSLFSSTTVSISSLGYRRAPFLHSPRLLVPLAPTPTKPPKLCRRSPIR